MADNETPKDETPKDETSKDETPKDETPKDETPKVEVPAEPTPKTDDIPAWGKELQTAISGISEQLAALAPVKAEIPGDGDIIPDESPVKLPWTHRPISFFGKEG